jgi:hypothetical protein
MTIQLVEHPLLTPVGVDLTQETTQDEWKDIHRRILICKKMAAKWRTESLDYATSRWGEEYAHDTEVQLELNLGIPLPPEKPTLNPTDKTTAIVTIEGLSQKFTLWERKMHDDITKWDKDRLTRALELLTPMEATAARIRQLLA